jgi:hypothetical protein
MKKFFKWLGSIVVVLVILAFAAEPVITWYLMPREAFDTAKAPTPPDYSEDYFWVAHPDKMDTSDLIPVGLAGTNDLNPAPIDVFFVHSTGYVGPGHWNSNMKIENSEAQSIEYMLSSMASSFNGCCDVYAPHYREAHIFSFISEDTESSYSALDLAYSDVETAFKYYLENFNNGRPFIIVSHSQGTTHALRLLEDYVDNTPLQQQLVAAYTLGYWLPLDKFERGFESLKLCTDANQTGCIVSYDAYGEGGSITGKARHWYKTGWEISQGGPIACVNPLSWKTDLQRAPSQQHLGAMPVEFKRTFAFMLLAKNPQFIFSELPQLTTELTWAQCDESGALHLAEQQNNAFSNHFNNEDKSYHLLDFSLFYGNIRQNAIQRTNAYFEKGADLRPEQD